MEQPPQPSEGPSGNDPLMAIYWRRLLSSEILTEPEDMPVADAAQDYLNNTASGEAQPLDQQALIDEEQERLAALQSLEANQEFTAPMPAVREGVSQDRLDQLDKYLRMVGRITLDHYTSLTNDEVILLYDLRRDIAPAVAPPQWRVRMLRQGHDTSAIRQDMNAIRTLLPEIMAEKVDKAYSLYRFTQDSRANAPFKWIRKQWSKLKPSPDIMVSPDELQALWSEQNQAWTQDHVYDYVAQLAVHYPRLRFELALSHVRDEGTTAFRLKFNMVSSDTPAYERLMGNIAKYESATRVSYWASAPSQ